MFIIKSKRHANKKDHVDAALAKQGLRMIQLLFQQKSL
jgi:hypothetical protein